MDLKLIKEAGNQNSLKRIIAFFGFLIMSFAFCIASYQTKISSEMFITYPLGLIILYVPQLAINLLKIYKGQDIIKDNAPNVSNEGG